MINVLIVEDEIPAQINLKKLIDKCCPSSRIVMTLSSVQQTIKWLEENPEGADVIFMDVELSDGICFEIFDRIAITQHVIITTAYDNYAINAFRVNSVDYLLKPIGEEDMNPTTEPTYRSEEDSIDRFDNKNRRNKRNKRNKGLNKHNEQSERKEGGNQTAEPAPAKESTEAGNKGGNKGGNKDGNENRENRERPRRNERNNRAERNERTERHERPEKPERTEKPELTTEGGEAAERGERHNRNHHRGRNRGRHNNRQEGRRPKEGNNNSGSEN